MLYASSLSIEDIETELKSFVLRIHTFIQQYVTGTSKEKEVIIKYDGNTNRKIVIYRKKTGKERSTR